MSSAYPISSPVEFTNTTAGDTLNFNADGPSTAAENQVVNFVTSGHGDILYRDCTITANALERLAIGSAGNVLTVTGAAVAEVSTITTVADVADSLDGTYFLLSSPTTGYYFWFSTGAGAVDPGTIFPVASDLLLNGELKTGVMVSITTGDTAVAVATALDPLISGLADFGTVLAAPLITVTNAAAGAADSVSDGSIPTGFTLADTTPGTSLCPGWAAPTPGSASETFLATATAVVAAAVPASATYTAVLDPAVVTWDDATLPNHDAGAIFAGGTFTVPTTGIYAISAAVSIEGNNTGTGGAGIITGRRAVRQARIFNVTTAAAVAFADSQTQARNGNPTHLSMSNANASLTAGDTLRIEVRHDATSSLALSVESDTGTATAAIYFTAHRVA